MEKELSKRKQKILQAVVDEYFTSAEPVSSGYIREKYMPEVSSATIRAELAALEEMGYLVQPHISAGRVPSPLAYKLYVEKLMPEKGLTTVEVDYIKRSIGEKVVGVEDIIRQSVKIISDITNYTSVIVVKNFKDVRVNEIKLVPIGEDSALVIIITDNGVLKDKTIEIPESLNSQYVQVANGILNKVFAGKKVEEILKPQSEVEEELSQFRGIFEKVIKIIECYNEEGEDRTQKTFCR
jgi:heat-inducible transcriptional repressor